MKSRNNFVSNSSSSSFIVCAPEEDKVVDMSIKIDLEKEGTKINFNNFTDWAEDHCCECRNLSIDEIRQKIKEDEYGKMDEIKNVLNILDQTNNDNIYLINLYNCSGESLKDFLYAAECDFIKAIKSKSTRRVINEI